MSDAVDRVLKVFAPYMPPKRDDESWKLLKCGGCGVPYGERGRVCTCPPYMQQPTSTQLFEAHESLKLEAAKLRARVAELECACVVARRALRRVRLLASGMRKAWED